MSCGRCLARRCGLGRSKKLRTLVRRDLERLNRARERLRPLLHGHGQSLPFLVGDHRPKVPEHFVHWVNGLRWAGGPQSRRQSILRVGIHVRAEVVRSHLESRPFCESNYTLRGNARIPPFGDGLGRYRRLEQPAYGGV